MRYIVKKQSFLKKQIQLKFTVHNVNSHKGKSNFFKGKKVNKFVKSKVSSFFFVDASGCEQFDDWDAPVNNQMMHVNVDGLVFFCFFKEKQNSSWVNLNSDFFLVFESKGKLFV